MRSRARVLGTALVGGLLTAAVLLLSACQSNVGLAAKVGDTRIGESDVTRYVTAQATPYTDANSGQQVVPKTYALNILIQVDLLQRTVVANGGAPSPSELATARAAVLSGTPAQQVTDYYTQHGFSQAMGELVLQSLTLQQVLSTRASTTSGNDLIALVRKLNVPVTVSPRYGSWNAANLALDSGGGLPSFLSLQTSAPASAAPVPAGQ